MKTAAEFTELVSRRTWDKDVAVFLGSEAALRAAVPAGSDAAAVLTLDLLDLFDEASIPDTEEDMVAFFRRALRQKLSAFSASLGQRRILIVKSAGLLVRYHLGLKEFFDWFVGDRSLVVVLIEDTPRKLELPVEIECSPDTISGYFNRPDLAKHTFSVL